MKASLTALENRLMERINRLEHRLEELTSRVEMLDGDKGHEARDFSFCPGCLNPGRCGERSVCLKIENV